MEISKAYIHLYSLVAKLPPELMRGTTLSAGACAVSGINPGRHRSYLMSSIYWFLQGVYKEAGGQKDVYATEVRLDYSHTTTRYQMLSLIC